MYKEHEGAGDGLFLHIVGPCLGFVNTSWSQWQPQHYGMRFFFA